MTAAAEPVVLAWYACDLKTGRIAEELPSLTQSGEIGRKLGVSTSAQFDLDLNGAPPAWEQATEPGRTMLVAVDTLTAQPVWPGITLTRAGGTSGTLQLGTATPEAYFDRRYTGDYTGTLRDQALIMADLATVVLTDAPPFVVDAPAVGGTPVTYQLQDGDDRTVLSALQELTGMDGAPEWTVDVEWDDAAQTRFRLVLRVRPRIGVQSAAPGAVFDLPGNLSSYTLTESFEAGKGATGVRAWGDGEGSARLRSADHTAADLIAAGWCRWDYRYTPASGLADPGQLDAHATQALAQMRTGSAAWTLQAAASRAPRAGRDFALGDSIRVRIDSSPRHPRGAETVARCYAWNLDPAADTVTPILLEDD